jgi:hypothetical protein
MRRRRLQGRRHVIVDLKPMTGAELAHLVDDLLGAPQAIKDKVRSVMPERT